MSNAIFSASLVPGVTLCARCPRPLEVPTALVPFDFPTSGKEVLDLTVEQIRTLIPGQHRQLIQLLDPSYLVRLKSGPAAAMNVEQVVVPCMEQHTNLEAPNLKMLRPPPTGFCDGCARDSLMRQVDPVFRWYCLPRGNGYTGIIRGSTLYRLKLDRIQGENKGCAGKKKFVDEEEAKFDWLLNYYRRNCARVVFEANGPRSHDEPEVPAGLYINEEAV